MKHWQDTFAKQTTNQRSSGYEIRTKVLEMAADHACAEYNARLAECTNCDCSNCGCQSNGKCRKEYPSTQQVLQIAKEFLEFVNTQN